MWQKHGIRMEEFYNMEPRLQNLYIASELVLSDEIKLQRDLAKARQK